MATRKKKTTKRAPARDPRITEAQHNEAVNTLRAEYYQEVRGIAQDLARAIKDGEIKNQDDMETWIHQSVDGSHWVIYTHANFQVLMCSDNHDAFSDEYGEPAVSGNEIDWAKLAFAALDRDVRQQIEAEGIEAPELEERRLKMPPRRKDRR